MSDYHAILRRGVLIDGSRTDRGRTALPAN
jgi:hypothetical protein